MGAPAATVETLPPISSVVEAVSGSDNDGPPAVEEIESLCMRCHEQGTTRLLLTKIPHFRELVLMAFDCPHCGETNNEVTFAGSLQPWGCRITLKVPAASGLAAASPAGSARETSKGGESSGGETAKRDMSSWMNRQVVKSDAATISIPELEFEIPPEAQRGTLSTVEGVLTRARDDLAALQDERRQADESAAEKIDSFLARLQSCIDADVAFTLILDDPTGNSYIQSMDEDPTGGPAGQSGSTADATVTSAGIKIVDSKDPWLVIETYQRTSAQSTGLGYLTEPLGGIPEEAEEEEGEGVSAAGGEGEGRGITNSTLGGSDLVDRAKAQLAISMALQQGGRAPGGTASLAALPHGTVGAQQAFKAMSLGGDKIENQESAQRLLNYSAPEEVMVFPACCGACGNPSETRMYATTIPYFKAVIIMATTCDSCGWKSSELKPGGEVSKKARRITLHVEDLSDLSRDVIKSDTAAVSIPELEVELAAGTMGGMVTTVEGLVSQIADSLARVRPFEVGDSAPVWKRGRWAEVGAKLKALAEGRWEEALSSSSSGDGASSSRQEDGAEANKGWHLVLDDSMANSFISFSTDRMEDDTRLRVEEYERSWEQDEELGLHDINTDGGGGQAGEERGRSTVKEAQHV